MNLNESLDPDSSGRRRVQHGLVNDGLAGVVTNSQVQSICIRQGERDQVASVGVQPDGVQTEYVREAVGDAEAGFQLEPPSVNVVGALGGSQDGLALGVHPHLQQLAVGRVRLAIRLISRRHDPQIGAVVGVEGEVDGTDHGIVADAGDVRQSGAGLLDRISGQDWA